MSRAFFRTHWRAGLSIVLDQGFFAASNVTLNVLLARWFSASEYGAFSVALSLFFVIGAAYTSVMTEPLMVFGSAKYRRALPAYIGSTSILHLLITAGIALVVAAIGLIFLSTSSRFLGNALLGSALAAPFILLTWLMRAACYVKSRPHWAAIGGILYFGLTIVGLYGLAHYKLLGPGSAFVALGAAAILPLAWFFSVIPGALPKHLSQVYDTAADHWSFGSWNALAAAFNLGSGQMLVILIPPFFGLEASAQVAVALNLLRPLYPVIRSISNVALPAASRSAADSAKTRGRDPLQVLSWVLPVTVIAYGALASMSSSYLLPRLYNNLRYQNCGMLIFVLALTYSATSALQVLSIQLKAQGATRALVRIWAFPALLTLLLAVPTLLVGNLMLFLTTFAGGYWLGVAKCWRIAEQPDISGDASTLLIASR